MTASILPNEILHHIFRSLQGSDVIRCRSVCNRWEEAVDGLRDGFWKGMCAKEYTSEVYESAYRKAGLSWRELYASLTWWSDVATADVRIKVLEIQQKDIGNYHILSGGILAVCCRRRRGLLARLRKPELSGYDTIVHYDLDTLAERHSETFDFTFKRFAETEYVYVLELNGQNFEENRVKVMLKSNGKCLDFGKDILRGIWSWVLHEDLVYLQCFYTRNYFFCVEVVKEDNDYILEVDHRRHPEYRSLPTFGLNTRHSFTDKTVVSLYAKTVMVHSRDKYPKSIDIYYVPHGSATEHIKNTTPTKSIDLRTGWIKDEDLEKIGVVETGNGHRIIVSFRTRILVIELSHNEDRLY